MPLSLFPPIPDSAKKTSRQQDDGCTTVVLEEFFTPHGARKSTRDFDGPWLPVSPNLLEKGGAGRLSM